MGGAVACWSRRSWGSDSLLGPLSAMVTMELALAKLAMDSAAFQRADCWWLRAKLGGAVEAA